MIIANHSWAGASILERDNMNNAQIDVQAMGWGATQSALEDPDMLNTTPLRTITDDGIVKVKIKM